MHHFSAALILISIFLFIGSIIYFIRIIKLASKKFKVTGIILIFLIFIFIFCYFYVIYLLYYHHSIGSRFTYEEIIGIILLIVAIFTILIARFTHVSLISINKHKEDLEKEKKEMEEKVKNQNRDIMNKEMQLEQKQRTILKLIAEADYEKENVIKEREKINTILESMGDGVIIINDKFKIILFNRIAEQISGYSAKEVLGNEYDKVIKTTIDQQDLEEYAKLFEKNSHHGEVKKSITKNTYVIRKDGKKTLVSFIISPIIAKGKISGDCVIICRDITKEMETEEKIRNSLTQLKENTFKLAEQKARIDSLFESIGDGIVATNQDGEITLINKSALEMLDIKESDVLNKSAISVLKVIDERGKEVPLHQRPMIIALSTGLKTSIPHGKTYYFVRRDGSKFPVGITVTPFIWHDKIIGTIEVFRDITIEKNIDKAKTEFVSLASHQMRTPPSAINWYVEMLLSEEVGKLNPKQKKYLHEIYGSNQRIISLVNGLLNVSRIELGTFAVEIKPANIEEIADTIIKEFTPQLKAKKIEIIKKFEKNIQTIPLDPNLTQIIFQNLISNAIKYSPKNTKVYITIKKDKENVMVSVKDKGYGIPQKDQKKIFTKLFRADNIKERDNTGNGLGLYIVKAVVEQTGGKIWFESEENKGTTFYLTIPLTGMKSKEGTRALI